MSIAFPMEDSVTAITPRVSVKRQSSARRIAANRANALKSTGPRTVEGKKRSSQNAVKHGLCKAYSCLPEECEATFNLFISEMEEELRPRTNLQRMIFPRIVNLMWRLRRLPEMQTKLVAVEREKIGENLPVCEIVARRFSEDPKGNAFLLLQRYERSLENGLSKLMREFKRVVKEFPIAPYEETYVPRESKTEPRVEAESNPIRTHWKPARMDQSIDGASESTKVSPATTEFVSEPSHGEAPGRFDIVGHPEIPSTQFTGESL